MNTLSKNRILQDGDEYFTGTGWQPVPNVDHGLQIMFTKYDQVRRPSENTLPAPVLAEPKTIPHDRQVRESTKSTRSGEIPAQAASRGGQTLESPIQPISPDSDNSAKAGVVAKAENEASTPAPTRSGAGRILRIKFPPTLLPPIWTGRNGTFNGYGLECYRVEDKIAINPCGKRGAGNCIIEFPVSIIPQLTDWLIQQERRQTNEN